MPVIFVSYRRDDSESTAGRIYDRLVQRFDKDSVLIDVDSIVPGFDFREYINGFLDRCDIMAAIVGREWAGPQKRRGPSRIDEESDWVRIEIEAALKRNIPLIPVLVNGADMPKPSKLPDAIRPFAFRQALVVRNGRDFHSNVDYLIKSIESISPQSISKRTADETVAATAPLAVAPARAKSAPHPASTSAKPNAIVSGERDRHLFGPGPKRLLALDAGGLRAIISIAFLERLENVLAEASNRDQGADTRKPRLADHFDIVGGTSTGGLIATLIALGQSAAQVREMFAGVAKRTFKSSRWRLPLLQQKFDTSAWGREIEAIIGDRSLDTSDLVTGLGIVAKRFDTGSAWMLANNPRAAYWETPPDNSYFGNRRYRLANLVRAATAVPGYFEPVELPVVGGETAGIFVDGGMSMHSNPSLLLLMMATLKAYGLCWRTDPDNLSIASIGTGSFRKRMPQPMGPKLLSNFNLIVRGLHSVIGEAEVFVLSQMQLLGECPMPWNINSEVGTLANERPFGGPHFRFLRYDVRLETGWLDQRLGLKITSEDLEKLRSLDDPGVIPDLYHIGQRAAEILVKAEHWTGAARGRSSASPP